jgi:hypothetical protein
MSSRSNLHPTTVTSSAIFILIKGAVIYGDKGRHSLRTSTALSLDCGM